MTRRTQYFFFTLLIKSVLVSQTLSPLQEQSIKNIISKQFGTSSEHALLNLGLASFCIISDDTLYNPSGYNYVFKIKGDSAKRLDHSLFHGNNNRRFLFSWQNKLYTLGGYGFFTTNNNLTFFNKETSEWTYEPVKGALPPFILGLTFKSGQYIYSLNNYKSGNNSEPDKIDSNVYRLNLSNMSWQILHLQDRPTIMTGEAYYTNDFCFFHGKSRSIIFHTLTMRFLEISNDSYGLASNSYINFIEGNTISVFKYDNNENPLTLKLDVYRIWNDNLKKVRLLQTEELKSAKFSFGIWSWGILAFVLISISSGCVLLYLRKKSEKPNEIALENENVSDESLQVEAQLVKSNLINAILNSSKTLLNIDELDEMLNILHLEPESRKLRRHRLLNEVQKEHPTLITRVKDSTDRRRFLYKITIPETKKLA